MSEDIQKAEKMLEEIEEKEEKAAKQFNIDEFTADAEKVYEVKVKGVGVVKFKHLTIADVMSARSKDAEEQGLYLLYLMLHKADAKITFEKVKALPIKVFNKIFNEVKPLDFL